MDVSLLVSYYITNPKTRFTTQEINSLIHQGFIFLMKWIKEEKEREREEKSVVNLSFSFRTPSTSWYLLVGVKKTRYDKRFLGREDNKTKITTNRGNENSLSLFSSSFVSMSKEKMMKEEKGRERHRLENIAKDRKVIPDPIDVSPRFFLFLVNGIV